MINSAESAERRLKRLNSMLKLNVIGKYGPYPKSGGACSSYLVEINDKKILIDMGTGSLSNLQKKIKINDIDLILLSHLHSDHMVDSLVLRYALMVLKLKPIKLYMPGSPSIEHDMISSSEFYKTNIISEALSFDFNGAKISFKQTMHPVETYAIKIEYYNKTFVFSSDTLKDDKITDFAKNCDLFLCDSAFLEKDRKEGAPHPSALQAAIMAKKANVKKLLLTHISPLFNEIDVLNEAKTVFKSCEVVKELKSYDI